MTIHPNNVIYGDRVAARYGIIKGMTVGEVVTLTVYPGDSLEVVCDILEEMEKTEGDSLTRLQFATPTDCRKPLPNPYHHRPLFQKGPDYG